VQALLGRSFVARLEALHGRGPQPGVALPALISDFRAHLRRTALVAQQLGVPLAELAWHDSVLLSWEGQHMDSVLQAIQCADALQSDGPAHSLLVLKLYQVATHAWLLKHKGAGPGSIDTDMAYLGNASMEDMHSRLQTVTWLNTIHFKAIVKYTEFLKKATMAVLCKAGMVMVVSAGGQRAWVRTGGQGMGRGVQHGRWMAWQEMVGIGEGNCGGACGD
jgi:hypothetical protein